MHFYVLVLALLAVALTDSARDPDVEKCHKKHPLDNYKPGMTFSKDQKCLVACLLEAKGVMKNGKIDLKKAISVGKTVCPKSDHMKNEKKCEGCIKKTEDEKDNCMKAYDFVECVDKKDPRLHRRRVVCIHPNVQHAKQACRMFVPEFKEPQFAGLYDIVRKMVRIKRRYW